MDNCTFTINIDGEDKIFYTEKDLNSFLQKYYNVLSSDLPLTETAFSKIMKDESFDKAETTYYKLQKFREQIPTVTVTIGEGGEKIITSPQRRSVTQITRELAEKDPDSGLIYFSQDNYIKNRKANTLGYLDDPKSLNDPTLAPLVHLKVEVDYKKRRGENYSALEAQLDGEIMKLINKDVSNWSKLAGYGTHIHSLSEAFFQHKLSKDPNPFTVEDFPSDIKELSLETKSSFLDYMNTLYGNLEHYHKGPIIAIPEYKMVDEASNAVGVIDLLVIDKDGVAHIYDFKASYKASEKWHSAKRLNYTYQLGAYQNMLRNKGIQVDTCAIIPLIMHNVDYETETIEAIHFSPVEEISFGTMLQRFLRRINLIVPIGNTEGYESSPETKEISSFLKEAIDYNITLKSSLANVDEFIKKHVFNSKTVIGEKAFIDRTNNKAISVPEEGLRAAIEDYFQRDALDSTSSLINFKNQINKIVKGDMDLMELSFIKGEANERIKQAVANAFRKYTIGTTWKLIMDDSALDELGILMFVNEQPDGKNTVDLISFTINELSGKVSLNGRQFITGKFAPDTLVEQYPDLLKATNGNIELIKLMAYVNANAQKFKDNSYKIGRVLAFNRNTLEFYTSNLDKLKFNYDLLSRKMGRDNKIVSIPTASKFDLLYEVFTSAQQSDDISSYTKKFLDNATSTMLDKKDDGRLETLREVEKQLRHLLIEAGQMATLYHFDTKEKILYARLEEVIAQEEGRPLNFEQNMRELERLIASPGNTTSEGANYIHGMMEAAMQRLRTKQLEWRRKSRVVADDFLEKKGFSKTRGQFIGDMSSAYNNMFRKKGDNIDGSLMLKDPYDMSSDLTPDERAFVKYFLAQINSSRFQTDDPESDMGKTKRATGEWFFLPLMRGRSFNKMFKRNIGDKVKEYVDTLLDPTNMFDAEKSEYNKNIAKGMYEMTNTFDLQRTPEGRDKLIQSENLGAFETDLEVVLDFYKFVHIRADEYNKVLPSIMAMRVAIMYQGFEMGIDLKVLNDYLHKQTENVLYSKPFVSTENQVYMKGVRLLKDVTTYGNMALNPVSGVTNLMTGLWANLSRLMARTYGKDMFSYKDFGAAFGFVTKDCLKSMTDLTWLEELNMFYGLNNMDTNNFHEKLMQYRAGALNFKSGQLFWAMSAPDYFNRMVLFTAQMKHDGCFDAHSMKDGVMVYDFKKDERFSIYNSKNVNHAEYANQKALYNAMRLDFNSEGYDLKEGDALPAAYNNQQRNSLKAFADGIHGHYDHAVKSQYVNTILGSLFGQFKAWMVAKKNQYVLTGMTGIQGDYVDWEVNGVKYYMDAEGNPTTEVTGDPIKVWKGRRMEGILVSLSAIFRDIVNSDKKMATLWEAVKDPFRKDPVSRVRASNLRLLSADLGIVIMILLLFKLIGLPDKEDDPFGYQMCRAVMRSANDLNPASMVSAMAGTKNPMASVSYVGDIYNTFWTTLTGDTKMSTLLLSNVGMTRSFEPFVTRAMYGGAGAGAEW